MLKFPKSFRMVSLFIIVIASAALGLAWPFFINLHLNTPAIDASKWGMGKGSQYDPMMTYEINYNGTKFQTTLSYEHHGDIEKMHVDITPINHARPIDQTIQVGPVYFFSNVSPAAAPYFRMLDNSLFSMNWYATNYKYLAIGASWGDVYIGGLHEHMRVRSCTAIHLPFGNLDSYAVSYREPDGIYNTNWVTDNLPLPVVAKYHYPDQNLRYSYTLITLEDKSTPISSCLK